MHRIRMSGLHSLTLTGYVFGMLLDCPHACGKECPLYSVRQVDLTTTFYYVKSLSRDDKMWLVYRYEHCPVRLGRTSPDRRDALARLAEEGQAGTPRAAYAH
jgi:hypothetical protein